MDRDGATRSDTADAFRGRRLHRGVTLLELLGVVAILAIVAGLVFPATEAMRRHARRRQAQVEAHSLATAVLLYHDTYGRWPLQTPGTGDAHGRDIVYVGTNVVVRSGDVEVVDQRELVRALRPAPPGPEEEDLNPRRRLWLELDEDRLWEGYYLDPWSTTDQPSAYVVAVDANGDGWIGERRGTTVAPIELEWAGRIHRIPAVRERVHVFSWSGVTDATNRVSSLR